MQVSELFIHPVKSMASQSVSQLSMVELGPQHDRQWMVTSPNGKFLSQRTKPQLCQFFPKVDNTGLQIEFIGEQAPLVEFQEGQPAEAQVSVWRDEFNAVDCGDEIAGWLSQRLETDCRLVELSAQSNRQIDTEFAPVGRYTSFADGFPTLITTSASLFEFGSHLDFHIDMRRFRPNIVIDGTPPYAEDKWQRIKIADIEFDLVKPCARCIMPSIDPDTGKKNMEVNQALLDTRRRGRETFFGQNALHSGLGQIRVGDAVSLIS
ncbi:MAG: MOSC N-terminal beta barrel domain-containing protein [Pseudomonadota bacterium]